MTFVRRRLVALACLPLVLLSACGDGDSEADEPSTPSPSSSQTASPSAFPSPSESASTLPEDLPADEVEPEAFFETWLDAYSDATLTGDTARMRAMSSVDCSTCDTFAKQVEEIYANGGSVKTEGKPNRVLSLKDHADSQPPPDERHLVAQIGSSAGVTIKSKGASPVKFKASKSTWGVVLEKSTGQWRIGDIGV